LPDLKIQPQLNAQPDHARKDDVEAYELVTVVIHNEAGIISNKTKT
jgi:hypothetical protein